MALMMDTKPELGEGLVWEFFKSNLPPDVVCYNNRILANRECDFMVLIPDRGIFVIEVKSWLPDNVTISDRCEIFLKGQNKPARNPIKQARKYRFHVIDYFNEKKNLNPLVFSMVCYPNISKTDYELHKLNYISEESCTIFKEDLADPKLLFDKFNQLYVDMFNASMSSLDADSMAVVRSTFEPNYNEIIVPPMKPIALYSTVVVLPEIESSRRKEIIDNYFIGIKTIVFTSDRSAAALLLNELADRFDSKGLAISGSNIIFAVGIKNDFKLSNNSFSIFNFSLFCTDVADKDVCIVDGNYRDYSDYLYRLEEVTEFNFEQYRVEHAELKHILVKAGAGTGKTYSMVSRIAYLYHVDNVGINKLSDGVVMLTFTNEAADNMRKRIKKHFMNYYALTNKSTYLDVIADIENMQLSTIHKFANRIIQDTTLSLGLGHQFSITDSDFGRKQVYLECFGDFINSRQNDDTEFIRSFPIKSYEIIEKLMEIVDSLYQKGIDVKKIARSQLGKSIISIPSFNDMIIDVAQRAETIIDEMHIKQNEMQLNQMMIYCLNAIRSNSYKSSNYQYRYVFIDEFQDTDDMQIDIFAALQEKIGFKLFIVGDLKQSIYRFRGATMDAFDRMKMLVGSDEWAEEFSLRHNYRTDNRLLDRFNDVFSVISDVDNQDGLLPYDESSVLFSRIYNSNIDDRELYVQRILESGSEENRLDDLFNLISRQQLAIQSNPDYESLPEGRRSIAVLVRKNSEVRAVLKAGRERNIYVETRGGGDLYQSVPSHDLSTLLSALTHPNDINYLYALIISNYVNTDFAIQKISGCSFQEKKQAIISCLDQYFEQIMNLNWNSIVALSNEKPILVVLKQLYEKTKPWMRMNNASKSIDYQNNYDLIVELVLQRYDVESLSLGVMDEYLCNCILTGQEHQPRKNCEDNTGIHIVCLTIHKAKGLEFEYVDMPYTDRLIDSAESNQTNAISVDGKVGYTIKLGNGSECSEYYDDYEESIQAEKDEARILYVAMTRAISSLTWLTNEKPGITWNSLMREGLKNEH